MEIPKEEKENENIKFYELMIESANYRINAILKKGLDAMHELDKHKGIDWALVILRDEVTYFEEKIKKEIEHKSYNNKTLEILDEKVVS